MKVLGIGIILCLIWSPEARAQVFPGAVAGDKDLYVAAGGVATTLTGMVQANSTAFPVASVANMVPYELLVIDNEIVEECSFSPGTLQITIGKNSCPGADGRGIGGTTAASHASGARIADFITAEHHNSLRREMEAVQTALGANLSNIPGSMAGPPVLITKGGTGATTQSGALANILGVTNLPLNGLCFTNGPAAANCIGPGLSGTVLTSTGPNSIPSWQTGGGGGGGVSSVFGRTGTVAAQAGDYTAALVTNAVDQTAMYANPAFITSLAWSKITGAPGFITNPMLSPGDFIVGGTAGAPVRLAVPGSGTFCPNWSGGVVSWVSCPGSGTTGLTSVGITMPSAFNVGGSPLTSNGVISITGAGNATQYINGLGQLATFPVAGVSSVFGRTGAVTAVSGDYTTAQVTEMTNLYFTTARVYASLSGTAPIVFNSTSGNISCPTCGSGSGGVTSVFGRTGVVVAVSGDYNATQVTNAENITNKNVNGGYVGRDSTGSATVPGTYTASLFSSSDTMHTSLVMMIPGTATNFALPITTGDWGLFLDTSNGNKLTRQDSAGNKVVVEGAVSNVSGAPYTQSFTSQTSVALTHNLNLTNITAFNINCFDSTNALIKPSTVTATNANTVTVTFAVATTGSCTITTGGTSTSGGITQLTGDVTAGPGSGSQATTLATVNSASGACGDATHVCAVTTNAKGLVTSQSAIVISGGGGGSPSVGAVNHVQTSNGSGAFLDGGCTMVSSVLTCGTSLILSGAESALASVTVPTIRVDSTTHNMELTKAGDATADFVGVVPVASPGTSGAATLFLTNISATGVQASAAIKATDLPTVNSAPGSCGDATHVCAVTTTGNGLVTSQSAITITASGGSPSVGAVNHVQTSNGSGAFLDGGCTFTGSTMSCTETALASVTVPTFRIDSTTHNFELSQAGNATADFVGLAPLDTATALSFLTNIDHTGSQQRRTLQSADLPTVSTSTAVATPADNGSLASAYFFNNATGAITFNLPVIGNTGMQRCYRNLTGRTGVITITVPTGSQIDLAGANGTLSTGTLTSGGGLGDAVCLVADSTTHWLAYVQTGTWTNH